MRPITLEQAETKRQQAVNFLQRIGNDKLAEEFEDMTAEEYAEHKGRELLDNPHKGTITMARNKSTEQLQSELDEANDYIEELEGKLDDITGIATDEDDNDDSDSDDGDSDSDDGEDSQ